MSQGDKLYNKSGMVIFLISMVGSLLFFVYIAFIHPGVGAIDKMTSADQNTAAAGEKTEATAENFELSAVEKPWVESGDVAQAGGEVYKTYCAACHGAKGLADGVAATPATRNLVKGEWKHGTGRSIDLYETLQNGLEGTAMVSFKASLSKNQRWALVQFIRSITENKGKDDLKELEAFATSDKAD